MAPNHFKSVSPWISFNQASKRYGLTTAYLRAIALKGRLKAHKIGNQWITTVEEIEEYIRTRESCWWGD